MNEDQRQRILRVRETQKRIALGRLAEAARSVATIDRRGALLDRLIADTMPRAKACSGAELAGRMRFAARLQSAQIAVSAARDDAVCVHDGRSAELRHARNQAEIAARMVEAGAAGRHAPVQRRSLEELCRQTKPAGRG